MFLFARHLALQGHHTSIIIVKEGQLRQKEGKSVIYRSLSDLIEEYLKDFLKESQQVEINRREVAKHFNCVPSQINYVINTRFTQQHGYHVESKRGGGGYIRISKIQVVNHADQIDHMLQSIDRELPQRNGATIVKTLAKEDLITEREARLIQALMDKDLLLEINHDEEKIRSKLLRKILNELKYKR